MFSIPKVTIAWLQCSVFLIGKLRNGRLEGFWSFISLKYPKSDMVEMKSAFFKFKITLFAGSNRSPA